MNSEKVLDVVLNFVGIVVIADFDNFFFAAFTPNLLNQIVDNEDNKYEQLYTVTRTTSQRANQDGNEIEDPIIPLNCKIDTIYVSPTEQSCGNLILRKIYQLFRIFMVGFVFYFLPYSVVIGSYMIPYAVKQRGGGETD